MRRLPEDAFLKGAAATLSYFGATSHTTFLSVLLGGELLLSRLLTSRQDPQGTSRTGFHYWPKAHQSI